MSFGFKGLNEGCIWRYESFVAGGHSCSMEQWMKWWELQKWILLLPWTPVYMLIRASALG
jgi:hypothetical protein